MFPVHWYSFLSHLCHQRQRHTFAQLTREINNQRKVLGRMGTVLSINKPQMYHHCMEWHPCCPSLLLHMSSDSSATLGVRGITTTSFHFPVLPYRYSLSSEHFHSQFCLLRTAWNVSLSPKLLHCLWGVALAVSKCFGFGIKGRNPGWLFLVNNSAPSQQRTQYLHFQDAKMSHLQWFQDLLLIVQVLSPDIIKTMTLLNISTL